MILCKTGEQLQAMERADLEEEQDEELRLQRLHAVSTKATSETAA